MKRWLPAAMVISLGLSTRVGAETLRLAIVVGNNIGASDQPRLHYAEEDAAKMAQVLVELGKVDGRNLDLLPGRARADLLEAFARAAQKIGEQHQRPGDRALLLFYFSGHSDGESLELGDDKVSFSELRHQLVSSGADIRVAIVDSCRSGALLTAKGGHAGPAFDIRLRDDLPTSGQVLLTSSAADEQALESREIQGSYFTHHLVSGLRGAADATGRGRVTLGEAYRYAYERTVAATSDVFVGPQHPAYDYRLSGMGELVLTELPRPASSLLFPLGFSRALVAEPNQGRVLAEVPGGAGQRLVIPAGTYQVRLWKADQQVEGTVEVRPGESYTLSWSQLGAVAELEPRVAKGMGVEQSFSRSHTVPFALGGVGLAAAAVAIFGGAQVLDYQSLVSQAEKHPSTISSAQAASSRETASSWKVCWPVAAAAAAALGVGAVVMW